MIPARQPAPPPAPISLAKLLLVEGDTPMHFFEALLRHLGLDQQVEIHNFKGVKDLKTFLITLVATPQFNQVTSLGVVRDAEDKPAASARQSVEGALAAAGLTPNRVPPVRTAIYVLPDDSAPGLIETLCTESVKGEPSLAGAFACVEQFFACLQQNRVDLPNEPVLSKNWAQAYLATRKDVQLFPGLAAYRQHWPWNSPVFQPLIQFLRSL